MVGKMPGCLQSGDHCADPGFSMLLTLSRAATVGKAERSPVLILGSGPLISLGGS